MEELTLAGVGVPLEAAARQCEQLARSALTRAETKAKVQEEFARVRAERGTRADAALRELTATGPLEGTANLQKSLDELAGDDEAVADLAGGR